MMIKQIAFTILVLAAAAVGTAAQEKSPSNYVPGREDLAVTTFQKLVDISSSLDMLNLAVDLSNGGKIVEDHPYLLTAVLENIIFDYCNVSDSLMSPENLRVKSLLGTKYYTLRSFPEWDELGRLYSGQRTVLESIGKQDPPLHLVSDPLQGAVRLQPKKIKPLRDEIVLLPRRQRDASQFLSKKELKKAARRAKRR